jgi:two-component system phosphate regulon response regulator OmpR
MGNQQAIILSVDDDKNLQMVLREYLEEDGYKVMGAHSGRELEDKLNGDPFDVVLLDLGLPDSQGLGLITKIRAASTAPIIIVSGKSDTTEKIVGLEMGADDYITKPFEMRELSARIRAVLRRTQNTDTRPAPANDATTADNIVFKNWRLDRTQYQAFDSKGKSLGLTTGEFKLLEALAISANRALSREHLFDVTREGKFDAYDRAIDIQVARIRKKLGDDTKTPTLIKTVRGIGYMLCADPIKS